MYNEVIFKIEFFHALHCIVFCCILLHSVEFDVVSIYWVILVILVAFLFHISPLIYYFDSTSIASSVVIYIIHMLGHVCEVIFMAHLIILVLPRSILSKSLRFPGL